MITHKDQQMDRVTMKSTKDLIISMNKVCPSVITHRDQQTNQAFMKSTKDPIMKGYALVS